MHDAAPLTLPRPRTVLLTGATGFVGQAVLERLLREEAHVHLVIRPGRDGTAAERLAALLQKSAFDSWRAETDGDTQNRVLRRLHVVEADLGTGLPALPHDLDLVIHSASSVSFDAPWDTSIRANVLGPKHLYEALLASGATPHVIHVSTSYVGTDRVDVSREEPVAHDANWRTEVEDAFGLRDEVGTGAEADATLQQAARRRARDLGWTDGYTMTKALGERVAEDLWAARGHRLTVLRPTIIESALQRPHPGWIDGFKVADPLIAAYAKNRLPAFPGHPDAVLDIVPVDVVVDAITAASVVDSGEAVRYLQVGTGVSNPIELEEFRGHVEAALRRDPWTGRDGTPIHPRPWRFIAPHALQTWAGRRVAALRAADRALSLLPDAAARSTRRRVRSASRQVTTLRTYVGIYQPYTCSRTVYDDTRTRELLDAARQLGVAGVLDVTAIDWRHYLQDVHMPSLRATAEDHRRRTNAPTVPAAETPQGLMPEPGPTPTTPAAPDPIDSRDTRRTPRWGRPRGTRRVADARA